MTDPAKPAGPAPRLLIVGWDAADWSFIDPMLARGELPNLARLAGRGVRSALATLDPKLSPILWTTVATGKTGDKHGILNFVEADPAGGGLRLASSTSRRTKALWNILTQHGLRVNVVSWYASHPAEPISGLCVSNLFAQGRPREGGSWPMATGAVHPPSEDAAVSAMRVDPSSLGPGRLTEFVPEAATCHAEAEQRLLDALATHLAQARSVHAASMHAVGRGPWDCTMVFHDMIDALGHHFMTYVSPRMKHVSMREFMLFGGVMAAAYREQDRMLGELLDAAGEGTDVILLSDHGFHNGDSRPVMHGAAMSANRIAAEAAWHAPAGVLVMAGPGVRAGAVPLVPGLLDIAPTALALLGLPMGRDMDGRVLAGVIERPAPAPIASWDDEPGDAGLHAEGVRQDPFEAFEAIQQLVDLGYMQALPKDAAERVEFARVESDVNLSILFRTTGRAAQAIPVLERVLKSRHPTIRHVLGLADALVQCGRYEECAELAARWLDRDEADQPVLLTRAIALTMLGRHAEAAHTTDLISASDSDGCAGLGDLCIAQGRPDPAERWFRKALGFQGRSIRGHVGLAQVALLRDRLEACANHCLDAADIDRTAGAAHYLLGVALAWFGSLDDAGKSFEVASTFLPRSARPLRYLALVKRELGDTTAAEALDARANELEARIGGHADPIAMFPRPPHAWNESLRARRGPGKSA
jgi:tetratricopeptide (TPR) repeat protein